MRATTQAILPRAGWLAGSSTSSRRQSEALQPRMLLSRHEISRFLSGGGDLPCLLHTLRCCVSSHPTGIVCLTIHRRNLLLSLSLTQFFWDGRTRWVITFAPIELFEIIAAKANLNFKTDSGPPNGNHTHYYILYPATSSIRVSGGYMHKYIYIDNVWPKTITFGQSLGWLLHASLLAPTLSNVKVRAIV